MLMVEGLSLGWALDECYNLFDARIADMFWPL